MSKSRTYTHLSCEERVMIQLMLEQGRTLRAIARSVHRAPSTISRELARNGWCNPAVRPRPVGRPPAAGGYRACVAHRRARALAAKSRCPRRLRTDGPLWPIVRSLLRGKHSPEQIAAMLARMHPDTPQLRVSHESIYTAIYAMPRGALRKEVIGCLRQGRKRRRPRTRGQDRRGQIPNMVSIHERPPEVDERLVPGHWEGDLIVGARNASAIGTLVERTTLFTVLARVQDTTAAAALQGFGTVLQRIDAQLRLSLTYDQGKEMARHQQLSQDAGIAVYFADPHSPWQRGINENTNGLLRQYFPKGTDLSQHTQDELDAVAWQLNTRPRKSLGWKCPAELFTPDEFDFEEHFYRLVALGA